MNFNLSNLFAPDVPLSVEGLTLHIQNLLEHDPELRQVWVMGEVSSSSRYRSGIFFTLQDPDADASISCVVWNSQINQLAHLPVPGEQFIILGRIRLHRKRGSYQLNVWQALPAGEGLRALRYRQLRQKLEQEGIFDAEHKRPLPSHPQTIAVVTSPQAAAWGDIQRTLRRRYPGLHVLFSPALVQGDQAPDSIVRAIRRVEADGRAEVLLLSRGGGATEDMDCFNAEHVVRAIAHCSIPVVSGIGHQRDESLADLAADLCVHTPTAAAEQSVPLLSKLYEKHVERYAHLQFALANHIRAKDDQLHRLKEQLHRLQVDQQIEHEQQAIDWFRQRLMQTVKQRLRTATQHHVLLQQKLQTLDPKAVLKRGYALMKDSDNRVVRSIDDISPGEEAIVLLADGTAHVTVNVIHASSDAPSPDAPATEGTS
ncbi:MAG: exodeoxyribonuclease VII large subunit [Leptolyngbyaceae bacterium]|nr:exodeoxyribonuclease VII large subunit [Leptolyngbyaceae bacterium]